MTSTGLPLLPALYGGDYELAFDGAEDLIPSEFYREPDAQEARNAARFVVERVRPHVPAETSD